MVFDMRYRRFFLVGKYYLAINCSDTFCCFSGVHQVTERDLQGAGGGGSGTGYTNPALNVSTTSVNVRPESSYMGSNDFIGEYKLFFLLQYTQTFRISKSYIKS